MPFPFDKREPLLALVLAFIGPIACGTDVSESSPGEASTQAPTVAASSTSGSGGTAGPSGVGGAGASAATSGGSGGVGGAPASTATTVGNGGAGGGGIVGGPCQSNSDCPEGGPATGGGICIMQAPGGYCSIKIAECSVGGQDPLCPAGSICANGTGLCGTPGDFCLAACANDADCRPSYGCKMFDLGKGCFPLECP